MRLVGCALLLLSRVTPVMVAVVSEAATALGVPVKPGLPATVTGVTLLPPTFTPPMGG